MPRRRIRFIAGTSMVAAFTNAMVDAVNSSSNKDAGPDGTNWGLAAGRRAVVSP